ncbi:hypothetical protein V8F33_010071 [Rhypophila sp. PSN 637]
MCCVVVILYNRGRIHYWIHLASLTGLSVTPDTGTATTSRRGDTNTTSPSLPDDTCPSSTRSRPVNEAQPSVSRPSTPTQPPSAQDTASPMAFIDEPASGATGPPAITSGALTPRPNGVLSPVTTSSESLQAGNPDGHSQNALHRTLSTTTILVQTRQDTPGENQSRTTYPYPFTKTLTRPVPPPTEIPSGPIDPSSQAKFFNLRVMTCTVRHVGMPQAPEKWFSGETNQKGPRSERPEPGAG